MPAGTHQARARNFDYVAPLDWWAHEGVDRITLSGPRYPYVDFAEFRFYGATEANDALTLVGRSSDPHFS
ncbi:hypothetical protein Q5L94_13805, partial [Idiomarina sp. Sol25]|uniref:hypothetical protein n=1 Tax=Idiomarina sp. Sol25 TaxID=3064000 RepID=UPI00294B92EE